MDTNGAYIQNQFCSYRIALKLKELGFDEECLAVYFRNKFQLVKGFNINNVDLHVANQMDAILAPLWQQVIDWFREKHGITIELLYRGGLHSDTFEYSYQIWSNQTTSMSDKMKYEEAREQAILKTIELCKKN